MDKGKIIALDSPAALKRLVGKLEVIEIKAPEVPRVLLAKVRRTRGIKKATRTSEGLRLLTLAADAVLGRVVGLATETGMRIDSLRVVQPTLEDVFVELTGRTLRD
jgi:ABC-2 type transport system ATP-binding protein